MSAFAKLDIKVRLILGFSIVPVVMMILITISIFRVNSIDQSLATINNFNSVKQRYAINFRGSVHDRAISVRDVVLNSDKNEIKKILNEIELLAKNYKESADPLDQIFSSNKVSAEEIQLLKDIKATEIATMPLIEKTIRTKLDLAP